MTRPGGRRDQVLALIRHSDAPLDDDQIAQTAQMNRVYVNMICRQLAEDKLIVRSRSGAGKLVNSAIDSSDLGRHEHVTRETPEEPRRWRSPRQRAAERIQQLTAEFAEYVAVFEASQAFPGPSLYFHLRAIERRRAHQTIGTLLEDRLFLEYVYAVLPAWGMHRMGPQAAKVGDFAHITTALREKAPELQQLWPLHITTLGEQAARDVAAIAWDVIAHVKVSTSRTQIVAGSKFLHHLLPDLIPPIDRQYTFNFFTGQKMVPNDQAAIARGGFMDTGEAKVIDNAIMGFMQRRSGLAGSPVG